MKVWVQCKPSLLGKSKPIMRLSFFNVFAFEDNNNHHMYFLKCQAAHISLTELIFLLKFASKMHT